MKRSDLTVGAELAHAPSNDWETSPYAIRKVIVADTRPFTELSYRSAYRQRDLPPAALVALADGTTVPAHHFAVADKGTGVLVHVTTEFGTETMLVQLAHLRGAYEQVHDRIAQAVMDRQAAAKAAAERKAAQVARVQAAAEALKEAGVPVGYVSSWQDSITLRADALEAIVRLIGKEG